jgi:hypothetical protein
MEGVGYLLWVPLTPASFVVVAGALPHASLVTWHSRAAGLSLVNAGDESGGLLTLHPGGVASGWCEWREGVVVMVVGRKKVTWRRFGGCFQIWARAGRRTAKWPYN